MLSSLRISVFLLILCGGFYPILVTGIGHVLFHHQAEGSIILGKDGTSIGSEVIAQAFDKDNYFHPRPSAAGPDGYDATQSGGSNRGVTNADLISSVKGRVASYLTKNGLDPEIQVPADAVTASGSGLDPDISPDNAFFQVRRIALARNLPEEKVRALVLQHIEGRTLGILGEPRVNVLMLNLELDEMK